MFSFLLWNVKLVLDQAIHNIGSQLLNLVSGCGARAEHATPVYHTLYSSLQQLQAQPATTALIAAASLQIADTLYSIDQPNTMAGRSSHGRSVCCHIPAAVHHVGRESCPHRWRAAVQLKTVTAP